MVVLLLNSNQRVTKIHVAIFKNAFSVHSPQCLSSSHPHIDLKCFLFFSELRLG